MKASYDLIYKLRDLNESMKEEGALPINLRLLHDLDDIERQATQ